MHIELLIIFKLHSIGNTKFSYFMNLKTDPQEHPITI